MLNFLLAKSSKIKNYGNSHKCKMLTPAYIRITSRVFHWLWLFWMSPFVWNNSQKKLLCTTKWFRQFLFTRCITYFYSGYVGLRASYLAIKGYQSDFILMYSVFILLLLYFVCSMIFISHCKEICAAYNATFTRCNSLQGKIHSSLCQAFCKNQIFLF